MILNKIKLSYFFLLVMPISIYNFYLFNVTHFNIWYLFYNK